MGERQWGSGREQADVAGKTGQMRMVKNRTGRMLGRERNELGVGLSSGPQPFWHQGLVLWKTIFPRMGLEGGPWGPLLTSCCAAWFLIGHGLVLVHGPGDCRPL